MVVALPSRSGPTPQHFRDAPGLRDTPARREWRFSVEDLGDRPDAELRQVMQQTFQEAPGGGALIWVKLDPGVDPRSDEPCPDRALVVRGVAGAEIAEVARLVVRLIGRK